MIKSAADSPYGVSDTISFGLPQLDKLTGIGGVPRRRITEISGPYSVGKTTLALALVKTAQEEGVKCLWADIEFSWDNTYAEALGVNTKKLDLIQERYAESALDMLVDAAEDGKYGLIVLDAIGGLLPRQEAEKSQEGKTIGGQAKLVATFCRKIVPILAVNNIALIALNHSFKDLLTGRLMTSGGAKLEYHKSIHLSLRKAGKRVMQGENQVGEIIEAEVRKNKVAGTLKQKCELTAIYGQGFSREADLLQELMDEGTVTKKGNSYFLGEMKIGVGQAKTREWLKEGLQAVAEYKNGK
jgi:recombination protein RecA